MLTWEIKSQIGQLRNLFWSGWVPNPLTALQQITYLIFMKRLDDLDSQQVLKAKRVASFEYESVFVWTTSLHDKEYDNETMRRSHWSQLPADQMFVHVRDLVFPFLKTLHTGDGFAENLKKAQFEIPRASVLVSAVSMIENLRITEKNTDTAGDIYEYLLNEIASAGKVGQFRTPRHIIDLIVDIINPTKHESICDPACGSAGFLIKAYEHIIANNTTEKFEDEFGEHDTWDQLSSEDRNRLKTKTLHGYDVDSWMVMIALMNCILHGVATPDVCYADTLSKWFSHDPQFEVILANPPFKWAIDKSDIHPDFQTSTGKTELLFLELIYNKLKIWGRAWVIIPDGVLFWASNAHKSIRKLLIEKCWLKWVISLPSWVFKPYAWVSTAILIFVKWDITEKVWFYDLEADGYSLDDKRNKIDVNDIPDCKEKYHELVGKRNFENEPWENDKWFWVIKDEIVENNYDLSISKYKKIVYEPVKYEKPEVLIQQLVEIEEKIKKWIDSLKL